MNKCIRIATCATALGALALLCSGSAMAQMGGQAPQQQQQNPGGQPGYPQQNYPGTMNAPNEPVNTMSDADFAKDAAQGGMAEVKLGQLAQEKGSSDAVKNFGKQMVEDHSAANDKLKGVASQQNINLPNDISKKDQRTYDKLSQLSGAEFDRAYARDMVRGHQSDIAQFQQEANGGQNAAVKNFASQILPTLQEHRKLAKEMQKTVSATSTKTSPGGN